MRRRLPLAVLALVALVTAALFLVPSGEPDPRADPSVAGDAPTAPAPAVRPTRRPERADRGPAGSRSRPVAAPSQPAKAAVPDDAPAPEAPAGPTVWPADAAGIQGAVQEVLADIRDCYQQALAEVPELQGDLKIAFRVDDVDGIGQVTEVGILAGALEDVPMEDCVLDVFQTLEFDPPANGTLQVTYPVHFTAD